jgi:hypothetical protein
VDCPAGLREGLQIRSWWTLGILPIPDGLQVESGWSPPGLRVSPEDIVSKLLVDSWWTPVGLQWSIPGLQVDSIRTGGSV